MGWNSWNAFRTEVDEAKVMGAARALVDTGLARLGYVHVNIDDGWWLRRRTSDGRLEIRTAIFPSAAVPGQAETSFRPFVDRLHAMGLKAGVYTDIGRNACSQAWDLRSPNLPVGNTQEREVGLEDHVDQDIGLFFGEWGFDYLKVDACGMADFPPGAALLAKNGYRAREPLIIRKDPNEDRSAELRGLYAEVAGAIARHNPDGDYVFSICTWGRGDVRTWGGEVGNLWRTSSDIRPRWSSMLQSYDSVSTRALYSRPGAWNDPDMLFVGAGDFDADHPTEARSHFALWAMIDAPLLIGYDLRTAPRALLDIWGNADLVRINQDPLGNQAVLAHRDGDVEVLVKTLTDGRKALALFNRGDKPAKVTLTSGHLKFAPDAPVILRDLWSKALAPPFRGQAAFDLAPHETRVFEATGRPLLADGVYLSDMPARIHVATEAPSTPDLRDKGGAQPDATPYLTPLAIAGRGYAYGLGVMGGTRLEVATGGEFKRFSAEVGLDDASPDGTATATFSLYGDGRLLARSGPKRRGATPSRLTAAIDGVKVLELIVASDEAAAPPAATWANARVTR